MGYDMHAVDGNDPDVGYFRANIWGMQFLRSVMKQADVFDFEQDPPEWPKVEQKEGESEDDYEIRREVTFFPVVSACSPTGKVPIYKFCSNDGRLVTSAECKVIADGLLKFVDSNEKYDVTVLGIGRDAISHVVRDDKDDRWVREFADYCHRMVEHGGFKVY